MVRKSRARQIENLPVTLAAWPISSAAIVSRTVRAIPPPKLMY
jgi:hypothetical protein